MRYRIVDVFSHRPLAGNGLCVVLDSATESDMPAIAREFNLSETTFPTITGAWSYDLRIFTPTSELPFAGHPSLGTAWALGPGRWEQRSAGALVTIEADATGAVMTQPDPVLERAESSDIADALGIAGVESAFVATAAGNRLLLAPTTADLGGAVPDHSAIRRLCHDRDTLLLAAVRRVNDRQLHVRVFVPGAGIAEDPGTGGAAGPIGIMARRHWGTSTDITVHQGDEIGRPCRIDVHAEDGAITVGGPVTACAEGRLLL